MKVKGKGLSINKGLGCFIAYQCIVTGIWIGIELHKDRQLSDVIGVAYLIMAQGIGIGGLLYHIRQGLLAYTDGLSHRMDQVAASLQGGYERNVHNSNLDTSNLDTSAIDTEEGLFQKLNQRMIRLEELLEREHQALLSEKNGLQGLISDISHQIKTPMANVKIIHSTLLEQDLEVRKQRDFLMAMGTQLDKIEFLMQGMIKTSRLEAGVIELRKEVAPIYDGIASALGSVILEAEKKKMDIQVSCDESLRIAYDIKWTGEALFNILDNAVKYSQMEGQIVIDVVEQEMYLRIDVIDKGPGIDEQDLEHIFERFYRGKRVHHVEGIGIGLYLARQIIVEQGGYMKVVRPREGGTCFSIFLPNVSS